MAQTLEELKAENLENVQVETKQEKPAEKKPAEESEEASEEELKSEIVEGESEEEDESDEGKETWMLTDEQTSDDDGGEKKFTSGDIGAAKRKLKGKLQAETEEKNEWKEKYEALKSQGGNSGGSQQEQAPNKNRMPKLKDFDYDEDAHEDAMTKWVQERAVSATSNASNATSQAEAKQQAEEQAVKAVDDHYQRVETELVEKHKITAEVYQAADTAVRKLVESVLPQSGDAVTDALIARLGVGSEKVIYNLGRNKTKQAEFEKLLREDSTGLSAAIMLGQLKTDFTRGNRGSNATPPSGQLGGDASGGSQSGRNLKRKYENAKDVQSRFDIKRKAKGMGIDVSSW